MLLHSDVRRMVIGAGLDYNDLRVKQLAKAAFDLGRQYERQQQQQQQGKKEPNENSSNP